MEGDLVDLDDLRELADFMVEYDLAELAVEDGTAQGDKGRVAARGEPHGEFD
mgnify:CR=1 FL=1